MFKLSYSANGLTNLSFFSAIDEVEKAGFDGIELFFEPNEFNPFTITDSGLEKIKNYFQHKKIVPVAISTATICFLSDMPHEPSLLSLNQQERKKRIELIKKGIEIAKKLDIPIVSFQSGYLREEHIAHPEIDSQQLLVDGINECLENIDNITLVIEPEPGMYIETLEEAITLINKIDSKSFRLHLDICHAYCTEESYIDSISQAIPYIAYMHLADIKEGYNLRLLALNENDEKPNMNFSSMGYLIYSSQQDVFIFIDKDHCVCLHAQLLSAEKVDAIERLIQPFIADKKIEYICMDPSCPVIERVGIALENKAFLDSVSGVSFDVLAKAKAALKYLRNKIDEKNAVIITKPVCNTIKGKVHYHEVPGDGEIDFAGVLKAIIDKGYDGYITVELYNHSDVWEEILPGSRKYLLACLDH